MERFDSLIISADMINFGKKNFLRSTELTNNYIKLINTVHTLSNHLFWRYSDLILIFCSHNIGSITSNQHSLQYLSFWPIWQTSQFVVFCFIMLNTFCRNALDCFFAFFSFFSLCWSIVDVIGRMAGNMASTLLSFKSGEKLTKLQSDF